MSVGRRSTLPLIVLLLVAVAVTGCKDKTPAPASAPVPTAAAPQQAAPDAPEQDAEPIDPQLTVDELYKLARSATAENRMVAPPGKNALEYYLQIVEKAPKDTGAGEALRELFPFATGAAEQDINQGDLNEATRVIELLTRADPDNYTLTILRSKMDVKKRLAEREEQQELATAARVQAQAAATAAAPAATPQPAPATPEQPVAEAPAPPRAAPKPAAAPAPAPVGETRDVLVVRPMAPVYPTQALRDRTEGWVEVEFTVTADGSIVGPRVMDAKPKRLFDRAALDAVQRAKYEPRQVSGQAVTSTVRRRIEFKLGS